MQNRMRISTMRPRSLLLLAALLAAVAALSLRTDNATYAQTETAEVLPAPALSAQAGAGQITLTWNAVSGATRYELWTWQDAATGWQQLDDGNLTGTTYTHGGLTAGATYWYAVGAVDANGAVGAWSEFPSATVSASQNPTATFTSTATPTAAPDAPTSTPTPTSTSISTPTPTATAGSVPSTPKLTAQATTGGVELSWETAPHAVRYELWTWWDAGVGWQALGGANLTGTTYTHTDVTAGTTYYYSIRALNAEGGASGWLEPYPSATALAPTGAATPTPTVTATPTITPTITPTPAGKPTTATSERGALIALYQAADGANWKRSDNWLTDQPLADWHGIITDFSDRVIELDIRSNRLTGPVPDLSALASLTTLKLDGNDLTGPVPDLSALASLRTVNLSHNRLTAPFPDLKAHAKLRSLDLSYNDLTGPVPDLSALSELLWLNLSNNQLTGPIPDLSALASLSTVNLSYNQLTGSIPDLNALTELQWLVLGDNRLTGSIPDLSALTHLQRLALGFNQLTGSIPPGLGDLPSLDYLRLAGNPLSGCIPAPLRAVRSHDLDDLGLPDCAAPIPGAAPTPATTDRGALVALYQAADGANWRQNNNWLSDKPLESWYGVTTDDNGRVTTLELVFNDLTGPIPDLSALTNLRNLALGDNRLTGPIPDLSPFTDLRFLRLSNNELTGSIPDLSALSELYGLNLSSNRLTGPIPDLSAFTELKALILEDNRLTGPIPDLSPFTDLRFLRLGNNDLSGTLPDVSALTDLRELRLDNNDLRGPLPDVSALTKLEMLDLENNQLSGLIPDLSALVELEWLSLDNNQLSGPLPDLSASTNLEILDLDGNRLSGPVLDLNIFTELTHLDLSRNQFSGPLPDLSALTKLTGLGLTDNRFCLPAGASLSHADSGVDAHLKRLNLPACTAADLAAIPAAPQNLTATVANDRVTLAWDASPGAAGYDLWAWDSIERRWRAVGGTLTGATYAHTVATDGRNYYYQVRARDANGMRGLWSQRLHVIVVPQRFPPPPLSLGLEILYQKYMVVVEGVFVAAPSEVADEAMIQAGEVFTAMLSTRPDILQSMTDIGTRILINFESYGASGGPLGFEANVSGEVGYCYVMIHEYAHLVHSEIRNRPSGREFDARLLAAYNAALDANLYDNAYATTNKSEYWAEMVSYWFLGRIERFLAASSTKLADYDPVGAQLVEEVFGAAAVPAYCIPPSFE